MPVPADDLPSNLVPADDLPDAHAAPRKAAEPSTTAGGVAASAARGAAPYATGAAVGAGIGSLAGGIGAVPGAAIGAGAVGLTQLATQIYNTVAPRLGWSTTATPQEATDKVLDHFGIKRPQTAVERTVQATTGGAADALSGVGAAREVGQALTGPVAKGVAARLAEKPAAQVAGGAAGAAAGQTAAEKGYGEVGQVIAALGAGAPASAVGGKVRPQVKRLLDAGVKLVPGEIPGGMVRDLEQKARSFPILGHAIAAREQQSLDSFNRATANEALKPIGVKVPETMTGNQIVEFGQTILGNAYDSVLPNIQFKPGRQYATEVADVLKRGETLPQMQRDQLQVIVDQRIDGRLDPATKSMPGTTMKQVDGELRWFARNYMASPDGAQRQLGRLVDDLTYAMRAEVERNNPAYAEQLRAINRAYAGFVRVEDAAARRATAGGRFTTGDLLAAVKRDDDTVRHRGFAAGKSLLYSWARDAHDVMAKTVPDSGTPGRLMVMDALAGTAGYFHPHWLAGLLASAAPYTPWGSAAIRRGVQAASAGPNREAVARALGVTNPYLIPGQSNVVQGGPQ